MLSSLVAKFRLINLHLQCNIKNPIHVYIGVVSASSQFIIV